MCDSLHIPYKNLNPFNDKMSEVEYLRFMNKNWMAVERWADDILKCCCGGGGSSVISINNGCGTGSFTATQNFTITSAQIITFGDPLLTLNFTMSKNGVDFLNQTLYGNSSVTLPLSVSVSVGDSIQFSALSGITGTMSITINVPSLDQELTFSGCA